MRWSHEPQHGAVFVFVLGLSLVLSAVQRGSRETAPDYGGYRPHYQGFGVATAGGRGGAVLRVTNLEDRGEGSLRAALTATGPRFVIFEISGTIALSSPITVSTPYLTLAGQTAPSPGITVRNFPLHIDTHDVVIQHMRFRLGDSVPDQNADNIWIRNGAYNVVIDHCSLSWASDENLALHSRAIAILDCIVSEALANPDGRGLLLNMSVNGTATIARNLFAHNVERSPATNPGWQIMMLNNVVYNHVGFTRHSGFALYIGGTARTPYSSSAETQTLEVVHAGNLAIAGHDTPANQRTIRIQTLHPRSEIYLADNTGYLMTSGDQWAGVLIGGINTLTGEPLREEDVRTDEPPAWFKAFGIQVIPSSVVEAHVLANAGARPLDRDAVDARVVSEMARRTGRIIKTPSDSGGYPDLAVTVRRLTPPANANDEIDAAGRTVVERWLETFAAELEPVRMP